MRFAGKELDPESALMNFEARYYRNTWGRFTQVDPVQAEGALAAPQSWNRYTYAGNNPLRFIDPFGTCQYDPQTDRFTDTNGCVSLTVVAPYPDVVGAQVCYGYNANGEKYQQVSCSDQAIPGGGAYSGIGAQPGKSYPLVYPSASTRPSTPSPTPVPTPTPTPKPPTPNPKPPTPSPTPSEIDHQNFFEYLLSQPWVLSGILPLGPVPGVYGVGPAVSFAWNPQTRNACASVGLGMSAGHNVAIGPLTYVDGRADSVLDGMSASLGLNLPFPPVGGIGGQITFGASGVAAGVTAGVPGASGSVTWSTCTNRGQ
jgi:RHS repeat-associated protein